METMVRSHLHHEVRGSGPPVVFISGAGGDAGHFTRTAQRLADEFTTVAYDRRGCARSARLSEGEAMSIAAQADDAAALIEELGLAPAIVFGTSGGANILLELIVRRPDVVRGGLAHEPVLMALAEETEVGGEALGPIVELAAADPRGAMEAFVRTVMAGEATFESLDPELFERLLDNGAHFLAQEMGAFASHVPDAETIRRADVPLRLLVRTEAAPKGVPQLDRIAVRFAEQLELDVESISGNHTPYLQHPETFAEELRPILRKICDA